MHDNLDTTDEAAVTARFARLDLDTTKVVTARCRSRNTKHVQHVLGRLIRAARQDIARLREAIAAGWDIGPELAHEERRLAALEKEAA
jgi:hypothetical protein